MAKKDGKAKKTSKPAKETKAGKRSAKSRAATSGRDPKKGPKPSKRAALQEPPGVEAELEPRADHGEESYRGSGKLEGLAAVITGGDSGIGRAVAIAFAREGADVAIGYLGEEEVEDAEETRRWVEEAGRRCITRRLDVQERAECRDFIRAALDAFGRLDILVNNAAYQMEIASIDELTPQQIDRTFRTNIYGYIYMAQAALEHMERGGVILNTGSVTAFDGNKTLVDYSATKGAIHTFTKSLAHQVADRGVRVNCVAPGPVWTPLIPSTFASEEHVRKFGQDTLWGRPAQPAEIAPTYVFLASTDARYYSGEIFAPTGKVSAR